MKSELRYYRIFWLLTVQKTPWRMSMGAIMARNVELMIEEYLAIRHPYPLTEMLLNFKTEKK